MSFKGVNLNKLNGSLGRSNPTLDNVFAFVCPLPVADRPAGFDATKSHVLLQPGDADALGFTSSLDANKKIRIKQSIDSFYSYAPEATVHLIIVTPVTPILIMQDPAFLSALRAAKDVKGLAIVGTTSTVDDLFAMAEEVQLTINDLASEKRLIDFVLLEGKGKAEYELSDYPDFRTLNAANVTPVIAQDFDAASLDVAYKYHADVGSALGMLAARGVDENLGSTDIKVKPGASKGDLTYPLSTPGRYTSPALSDGRLVGDLSGADKKSLTDKGYIYAGSYEGFNGVFFNDAPTSVQPQSDYAYIENNRVWNKAARLIRNAMIPYVKGKIKKDPQSGYIKSTTILTWTNAIAKVLTAMMTADEISAFDVYVDPKQLPSPTTPVKARVLVLTDGIAHEFDIDLGLTNKIN